jgi:hypothetical protein
MGGGNPHIAEDSFAIPMLLVAVPFSMSAAVIVFVVYRKRLRIRFNLSSFKSAIARRQNVAE